MLSFLNFIFYGIGSTVLSYDQTTYPRTLKNVYKLTKKRTHVSNVPSYPAITYGASTVLLRYLRFFSNSGPTYPRTHKKHYILYSTYPRPLKERIALKTAVPTPKKMKSCRPASSGCFCFGPVEWCYDPALSCLIKTPSEVHGTERNQGVFLS